MKQRFKIVYIFAILMISLFVTRWFTLWNNVSCINFFTNTDLELLDKSRDINVKSLVWTFCDIAHDFKCEYDWYTFDASQSVFLSILCANVWKIWNYMNEDFMTWEESILKKSNFLSFDIYNYVDESTNKKTSTNYCDYTVSTMDNCDLSYFAPHIFDEIMNDFINIKQATSMWIEKLDDTFDKEVYANRYVKNHFPWYQEDICESKYYKNTCKYLKNYMWQVRNLLTTTKVIDVKNLSKLENIDCENDFDSNILYCGLLWPQKMPLYSLLRVIYNEYMRYDLFMSYYEYQLQNNIVWSNKFNYTTYTKRDEAVSANSQKAYKSQAQTARSKQAISDSMRSLSKIEYALPIHVGFLMYQEDAILFMKSLPKIYTPLRTLSDKLQNVQDADS